MRLYNLSENTINVVNSTRIRLKYPPGFDTSEFGKTDTDAYVIPSVEEIIKYQLSLFTDMVPQVERWFLTIFKNAALRGELAALQGDALQMYMSVKDAIDMIAEMSEQDDMYDACAASFEASLPDYAHKPNSVFFCAICWGDELRDGALGNVQFNELIDYLDTRVDSLTQLSVPDAIRLARQWHQEGMKKDEIIRPGVDYKIIHTFPDKYQFWQLLTSKALDNETFHLKHCIGKGTYDKNLNKPGYGYYSLRSPGVANEALPLATFEVFEHKIHQVKGYDNKAVEQRVWSHVHQLISMMGLKLVGDHTLIGLKDLTKHGHER